MYTGHTNSFYREETNNVYPKRYKSNLVQVNNTPSL